MVADPITSSDWIAPVPVPVPVPRANRAGRQRHSNNETGRLPFLNDGCAEDLPGCLRENLDTRQC